MAAAEGASRPGRCYTRVASGPPPLRTTPGTSRQWHDGPLAQLAEQWAFNPTVGGSIPSRPTIYCGGPVAPHPHPRDLAPRTPTRARSESALARLAPSPPFPPPTSPPQVESGGSLSCRGRSPPTHTPATLPPAPPRARGVNPRSLDSPPLPPSRLQPAPSTTHHPPHSWGQGTGEREQQLPDREKTLPDQSTVVGGPIAFFGVLRRFAQSAQLLDFVRLSPVPCPLPPAPPSCAIISA